MKRLVSHVAVALAPVIFLLTSLPVFAIEHKYIEDFTTTRYKDAVNTIAWWNMVAGELKLSPFVFALVGAYDTPGAVFEWTRNANDFIGASPQVVEYAIYRRIDPVAVVPVSFESPQFSFFREK